MLHLGHERSRHLSAITDGANFRAVARAAEASRRRRESSTSTVSSSRASCGTSWMQHNARSASQHDQVYASHQPTEGLCYLASEGEQKEWDQKARISSVADICYSSPFLALSCTFLVVRAAAEMLGENMPILFEITGHTAGELIRGPAV